MSDHPSSTIRTICGFCHINCGLLVTVKNGRITDVTGDPDHPVNAGEVCPKGLASAAVAHAPDRLLYPMRKTKGGFKKVSWDEALSFIADRLSDIRHRHGGHTVFRGGGAPVTEENRDGFSQLLGHLGSNGLVATAHVCHLPRSMGFRTVIGSMPQPDYRHTKLAIFWGANPFASRRYGEVGVGFATAYGQLGRLIPSLKKQGVKIIVIDPWENRLAKMADKWLRITPGRDDVLALAMMHVIIHESLFDREFVENYTTGFDALADYVHRLTPEWAEPRCGIPAEEIRAVAVEYATTKPALIREGNAIDQYTNAVNTTRAIAMCEALTGNVDRKGGNAFFPFPRLTPLPKVEGARPLSRGTYPMYPGTPYPAFVDAVFSGEPYTPRALLINHANTVLVNADSGRTRRAFEKLSLVVACDIFPTATTELADVVLPETSPLERYGFRGYAGYDGGFVALRNKAVEPPGECRTVFEIEYAIAEKMGLAGGFPFTDTPQWIDHRLKASGVTFADLKRDYMVTVTPPLAYEKYRKKGFHTPTGKAELYSERMKSRGYTPLPEYKDPDGWLADDPSTMVNWPLVGSTRRPGNYTHTQFRNIAELRRLDPECLLRIHPEDAAARGIEDGHPAEVESKTGRVTLKAKVTSEIESGVVLIDFGWGNPGDGGVDVNILTGDEDRDPVSCSTANHRFRCQVRKAVE